MKDLKFMNIHEFFVENLQVYKQNCILIFSD